MAKNACPLWFFLFVFILGACFASPLAFATVRVKSRSNSVIQFLQSKKTVELKRGQEVEVDLKEPAQVTSPDHIPIVLVPLNRGSDTVELDAPTIKDKLDEVNQDEVNRQLSAALLEVAEIQSLIQKKKLQDAQVRLRALQKTYPKVKFLGFIKASLLLLNGNREEARAVAEDALKAHPDYEDGKLFLQSIGGKR